MHLLTLPRLIECWRISCGALLIFASFQLLPQTHEKEHLMKYPTFYRTIQIAGLSRYTLYMQDYGGPVGFRMALAHPERIEALIVQDAVAHNEGLGANWKTRRAFWADRAANESALRTNSCRWRRRARATSETIPTWIAMTPISGPMNFIFSISPARPTFRAICSTTIDQTWRPIRSGKHGCARSGRACW